MTYENKIKAIKEIQIKGAYRTNFQKKIQAKHNVISILAPIGNEPGEYSSRHIRQDYKRLGSPSEITVEISSEGGSVTEGLGIYDFLKSLNATVTTRIIGGAFSIASVIALAGDKREIAPNSTVMIHNAAGSIIGDADELRKGANLVQKLQDRMLHIYQSVMNVGREKIKRLMQAETFFDASEAIGCGLCTSIIQAGSIKASKKKFPSGSTVKKVSATEKWNRLVAKYQKDGGTKSKAMQKVVKNYPQVHQNYLKEYNGR